jgi:hypothetical protein
MIDFFSRLDSYMIFKGLNDNKLTVETGISNGLIGKARKRGALSQDNISKILYKYADLDANWLFTGKGSMLKQEPNENIVNEPGESYGENYKERDIVIDKLQNTIDLQKEMISSLRQSIKDKEETNALLKDKIKASDQAKGISILKQEVKELRSKIDEPSVPRGTMESSNQSKLGEGVGK